MKGIYALLISVTKDIKVRVGALGDMDFRKGLYVYVGSAQNNLEKRIERHLTRVKPTFWHIDYLLSNRQTDVVEVLCKNAGRAEECRIARRMAETAVSIAGFGSSDCTCRSHLFRIEARDYLDRFMLENRSEAPQGDNVSGENWLVLLDHRTTG